MKIATITLFCREWFRADAWKQFFDEYRGDVYLHVIVNNGDPDDTEPLRSMFPDSLVLRSETPNMMASYNQALREILRYPEVDAIAQIVNDIRMSSGGFAALYDYLFSDPSLAMVSPVLLRGSTVDIDCFGCTIHPRNLDFVHRDVGRKLGEVTEERRYVTGLPAGIFLARRDAYERFGFQDEKLEMYADEVDMDLRAAGLGYRLGATSLVQAWHVHVNREGRKTRNPRAAFLMGRNHVYLASKHLPGHVGRVFLHRVFLGLDEIRSALMHGKGKDAVVFGWNLIKGSFAGLKM